MLPKIICIVGPTSSGKTAFSLVLAKKYGGEIINADARQLYRGFEIGTGKPSFDQQQIVPHYLFDEDPSKQLTVSEWKQKALSCVYDIAGRSRLPILVGGTGLYIQALVDNFSIPEVAPQASIREELEKLSLAELVERLRAVDPEATGMIDLRNPRRVIRALEVALTTGRSFAEQRQKSEPAVQALQLGIQRTREELYARSDQAVDEMLKRGWVDEVRGLLVKGMTKDTPAMSAIGYRELADVVGGQMKQEEIMPLIKQHTRNYIKRQITWFKKDPRIQWIENEKEAYLIVEAFLKS